MLPWFAQRLQEMVLVIGLMLQPLNTRFHSYKTYVVLRKQDMILPNLVTSFMWPSGIW